MQFPFGSTFFAPASDRRFRANRRDGHSRKASGQTVRKRSRRIERAVLEALECRRLLSGYTLSVLANFDMTTGMNPEGGVIMDPAGNLYGNAVFGGSFYNGTVFELPRSATVVTVLDSFNGPITGSLPYGGLLMDAAGNLFGTARYGGSNDVGTVFELSKANGFIQSLAEFNGPNGTVPLMGLVADSDGNLYGTASAGGSASI